MLGFFPKDISREVTFQGYFPKWQLPKSVLAGVSQRSAPQFAACGASEGLTYPSGRIDAQEIVLMGSRRRVKCIWENTIDRYMPEIQGVPLNMGIK